MPTEERKNNPAPVIREDPQKVADLLEQITKILRGDPTEGVYSMYVVAIVVELQR